MRQRASWLLLRHSSGETDDLLIERARGGDSHAFGELYRRHRAAAESTARWMMRSRSEVDDVVSEAFAGVLAALNNGHGPRDNFRRYLLACVRNGCRTRRRSVVTDDGISPVDLGQPPMFEDPERYVEADTVARAFASLSPRWQQTLWLTEVEQRSAAEVAEHLRLAPNATAALTHRAREAFATAYLAEHVGAAPDEACERHAPRLAAYVRDQLTETQREDVERHLVECPHCQQAVNDLRDLNASLRKLVPLTGMGLAAPLAFGTTIGMTSAGLFSSGLLVKGAVALLLVVPAFIAELSLGRAGQDTAPQDEIRVVHAEPFAKPPVAVDEIVAVDEVPVSTSSTEPPVEPVETVTSEPSAPSTTVAAVVDPPLVEPAADVDSSSPTTTSPLAGPVVGDPVGPVLDDVVAPVVDGVIVPVIDDVVTPIVDDVVTPVIDDVVAPVVNDVATPVIDDVIGPVINDVVTPSSTTSLRRSSATSLRQSSTT